MSKATPSADEQRHALEPNRGTRGATQGCVLTASPENADKGLAHSEAHVAKPTYNTS